MMSFLKKIIPLVLALAMVFTISLSAFAATGDNDVNFGDLGNITYGDTNDDGTVDIFDLIALAKGIVSNDYSTINETKADVDQNATIDIFDLISLAKKIVAQ